MLRLVVRQTERGENLDADLAERARPLWSGTSEQRCAGPPGAWCCAASPGIAARALHQGAGDGQLKSSSPSRNLRASQAEAATGIATRNRLGFLRLFAES